MRTRKPGVFRFSSPRMFPAFSDRLIYALCLIAPWSLLWLDSGLLFPYTTGKAWVFRSIVELAFVLSLIQVFILRACAFSQYSAERVGRVALLIMLGFLVWTLLCNLTGIDAFRSFWSNWERMAGFLAYLHWAMYLFCLLLVLNDGRSRTLLLNLVMVITLVCLIALLEGEGRAIATLGNPIYLGNLAVFGAFIALYLLAGGGLLTGWQLMVLRFALLVALVLFALALFKSASRGPMLALISGLLVLILSMGFIYARRYGKLVISLYIFSMLVLGTALVLQSNSIQNSWKQSEIYALQRLGKISLEDQTTADRLENWRIALDAAHSRLWMGWGQENYMIAFNQHYRPGAIDRARLWFDRAHNAYLDVLVASGIPGLVLYCLMLALPLWLLWAIPGWSSIQKSILLALFTSFAVKNLVGFDTFSSTLIWVSLTAVILNTQKSPAVENAKNLSYADVRYRFVVLILSSITIYALYSLNIRPYQENRRYAYLANKPLVLNSETLERVLQLPVSHFQYAPNAKLAVLDSLLINANGKNQTSADLQKLNQVYQRAGQLVNEALRQQPENYRIRYNGAILLARFGQHDAAILLLEELTRAAPKRTAFWHTLAKMYAVQGRDENASRAHKMAVKLNPEWQP